MAPRDLLEGLPENQPRDLLADSDELPSNQQKKNLVKAPPPSFADYAIDVVRVIPGGLSKGFTGIGGMAGDFLNPSDTEQVEGLGGTPIIVNKGQNRQGFPTTQQLNNLVSAPFGGYYQPKYAPGQYAETAAEFVPGVFGGEGTLIKRGLNTLGAAVGSETAGRMAEGTALETPMRIAGALVGHKVANRGQRIAETKSISDLREAEKATASVQEKKDAADTFYNVARNSGFVIANPSLNNFKSSVLALAKSEGIRSKLTPKADDLVNMINEIADNSSLSDLHDIRKIVSKNIYTTDKTDRRAVRLVLDKVDDYIANLKPSDVTSGDPSTATSFLTEAKKLWRQASQGDVIEQTIQKAKDKSGPLLNDFEEQLRKAFQKLRDNPRGFSRLDPEVQTAVKQTAEGTGLGHNAAYTFGKLVPTTSKTGAATFGVEAVLASLAPGTLAALPPAMIAKLYSAGKTGQSARLASVLARGGQVVTAVPMSNKQKAMAAILASQGTENQRPNYEEIE